MQTVDWEEAFRDADMLEEIFRILTRHDSLTEDGNEQ